MWKDNLVFYTSKSYLNGLYNYWRSQKMSFLYLDLYVLGNDALIS